MTFTIHRGANEIGGTCIEICSEKARIVIDLGLPLQKPYGTPFEEENAKEYLPDIPALYTIKQDKPTALLISHAHQDHYGLIPFIKKRVPVFLGKATHELINLTSIFSGKNAQVINVNYIEIENEKSFTFNDIEITPFLMDHAAFDAYAFLIKTDDKTLFYSGDFRAHGRKSKLFYKFLHNAPKNIDYLFLEGTTISRKIERFKTEEQIENEFVSKFKETKGINLVYTSGQNIDRLVSIYKACKRSGKLFVIDFYIANILNNLAELGHGIMFPSDTFNDIKVFFPNQLSRMMKKTNNLNYLYRFKKYKITKPMISENARKIVMIVRPSMINDIKQIQNLSKGNIIYSLWSGYKSSETTEKFLSYLTGRGLDLSNIHTSGHADVATLQKLVNVMQPKEIVPIHTDNKEKYNSIFKDSVILDIKDKQLIIANTSDNTLKENNVDFNKITLFECFEKVGTAHKSTKNIDGNFNEIQEKAIEFICQKLSINKKQAVIYSDILFLFDGNYITLKELADHIGCKILDLLQFMSDLELLEEKALLDINKKNNSDPFEKRGISFNIPYDTIISLRKNEMPKISWKNLSLDDFMTEVLKLCEDCVQRDIDYEQAVNKLEKILDSNKHLNTVKQLNGLDLNIDEKFILLRFCHYLVDKDTEEMDFPMLRAPYGRRLYRFRIVEHRLKTGTHILQQKGLIENANSGVFTDANSFRLTEKSKELLLCEFEKELLEKTIKDLISPDSINKKQLFYPKNTQEKIEELTKLLNKEKYLEIQNNLKENKMRTGFACLFSGSPGTGKTETAMQLARQTGRPIMLVDIAESKSKWFGESEKRIKEIFTKYRNAVKKSKITPILLFNEADAIIGKRKNLDNNSAVGQTENAIQNIILQEIENLNGILIATTNLTQNMDKAFERRFLYKIEFEKPQAEARKAIWKEMLPFISEENINFLAAQYEYTGGQIENISRRNTVFKVLSGKNMSIDEIKKVCDEENLQKTIKTIGFL
ncbi:MAG: AAA family ATPase [Bacteroidetes bacterium]|nr:AAA family ATPase [Bacteroidota bacterium]